MYKRILISTIALWCFSILTPAIAQQAPECSDVEESAIMPAWAMFNYGGVNNAFSFLNRSSYSLGEPVVGGSVSSSHFSYTGFWSRYLIPPFAPTVKASQGEFLDRIQITWALNQTGPLPANGYKIYRDSIFLVALDQNTASYNDFNVIAGRPYRYEVRGVNLYGEGVPGKAIGFQVPNGTVTGWVQTLNGSPVPDALVALTPLQGFSAKFGPTDGAFARADTDTTGSFLPAPGGEWTISFWLKSSGYSAGGQIMSLSPFPLYLRTTPLMDGIEVGPDPAIPLLSGQLPPDKLSDWNHVALTRDAEGVSRLYLNGELKAIGELPPIPAADELHLGERASLSGTWEGRLDELRIYHRRLDEIDLNEVMMGTASSQTPDLKHYWKMDEELGTGSFDVLRRNKLFFCGATFDADRPNVRTMGKTNHEGYYRIESASYGTGTTFLAEPMKNFYMHKALKMVKDQGDYATLPDFSVTPKATLELWVNSAGPDGEQCLISKRWPGNDFRLLLKPDGLENKVYFYLNGQEHDFGALGMGYQHLAFTIDTIGNSRTVTAYKNGAPLGTPYTFIGITGNWSDTTQNWILGARPSGNTYVDHFGGLLDEVALYDSTLSVLAILGHAQASRDMQEKGLRVYFALDEGNGNRLNNSGSVFLGAGTNHGADWSPFAANQTTIPHVFTPATRQVTLNPSITSVDQVDFTDRSTVAVSGFVRYKNTDCFAKNIEILVNGASFSPKIFTDSTGRFVIDFDPGATAILSPKFEDHVFVPASWEVINVASPLAGILFNDVTTRKISGQVAGGLCKKSIIKAPPGMGQGTFCVVKVRSADGCLERIITIDNQAGNFEFDELPPLERLTVAVVEHSDPDIKTAFQVLGGSTVDLSKKDTIVDFIYFAPPQVEIMSGLDPYSPDCGDLIVMDQGEFKVLVIKLKEQYVPNNDDGVCYLDSASFRIINGFSDEVLDTTMSNGSLTYKFQVGTPNPSPPYLKSMQVLGTSLGGREGSLTKQAIITGVRNKLNTFTSMTPEIPTIILRDPPGDGSSSFLEKNEKICKTTVVSLDFAANTGISAELHLGGDVTIVAAPLGVGTIANSGPIFDVNSNTSVTYQKLSANTFQTCMSVSSKVSTNDGDLIVGGERGADVYMGEAMNIIFGFADKVNFIDSLCAAEVELVVNVEPGDFRTTFIYSEFQIVNNVMRYLDALANDPQTDSASAAEYIQSRERWQAILDMNRMQKDSAVFLRNISFDSGVTFDYSETSDTATSESIAELLSSETGGSVHAGYQFQKFGFSGSLSFSTVTSGGTTDDNGLEVGITTGFTLADDDPGDAFTVDVAMDTVYKTPVFRLKSGQSSCPWEPGTANREGPNLALAPGSQFSAINIPANEAAVYQMNLGNLSASNEDWTYGFTAIAGSNPHGAVIKLNGTTLNNNTIQYIVPYGTSKPVTLTVERGPIEYDYDSLLVGLVSECEMARNFALSIPVTSDPNFFSPLYLGAHFIRPCSEVNINVPEQDWVIFPDPLTPGPDDERRITVSGYDTLVTDFQLIRVQYRRSNGDGAWLNITPLSDRYNPNWSGYDDLPDPKPPVLQPGFTQFFWETTGLSDGPYEIRAVAVCSGDATDKPGYSQIIKGRIDREPPSLIGTPQPSDGVYHVGDEISFSFNKHINCNKLIPADLTQPNNVALYDATTGLLIDIDITCFENRIIIDPNFQNEFFENKILRAELHDIEDLTGNKRDYLEWEFYVDRNELAWLTDSLGMTKYEDQSKTAVANIHNRGGYPVPFTITGIPEWVHVVPNQGTLAPNEIRPISFQVDSNLAFGLWSDSITLHTETGQNPFFMGGDEGLPFGVRVVCRPPHWEINPNFWENSENMVLELNIQGEVSQDVEDIVVAYIGDTLVGKANVRYVPASNKYLAYLTIYGNPNHVLLPLRLEIWDASACLRYAVVEDYFLFQPDDLIGDPFNPQVIHTNDFVLRDVSFGFGWNWLSFNLNFPDPAINAALESLNHPQNDLMKGQNSFSTYLNGTGWFGSLNTLGNTSMYVYRADQPDTLKMLGTVLNPATNPIPVVSGWNWIGYIPNYSLAINQALSSLSPQMGDLIKSQESFAVYANPTFGWIGNLQYMQPPKGYQLKLSAPGTLTYPPPTSNLTGGGTGNLVQSRGPGDSVPPANFWSVDPTQFENSMTLIGMLEKNDENVTTSTLELGAFVGNQVRGSSLAIYIPPLESYLFFLTVYANSSGEQVKYKLFDSSNGSAQDLNEAMFFSPDLHQGSIENPVPFTLPSSGTNDLTLKQSFEIQPNPFHNETVLRFALAKAQDVRVTVTDMSGKQVSNLNVGAREGLNTVIWRGQSDNGTRLANGLYYVMLQTDAGNVVRKVVLH